MKKWLMGLLACVMMACVFVPACAQEAEAKCAHDSAGVCTECLAQVKIELDELDIDQIYDRLAAAANENERRQWAEPYIQQVQDITTLVNGFTDLTRNAFFMQYPDSVRKYNVLTAVLSNESMLTRIAIAKSDTAAINAEYTATFSFLKNGQVVDTLVCSDGTTGAASIDLIPNKGRKYIYLLAGKYYEIQEEVNNGLNYSLTITVEGEKQPDHRFAIPGDLAGGTMEIELTNDKIPNITVKAVDDDGKGLENAQVALVQKLKEDKDLNNATDEDWEGLDLDDDAIETNDGQSKFYLPDAKEGDIYRITLQCEGYANSSIILKRNGNAWENNEDVTPDGNGCWNVVMDKTFFQVSIVDENGDPLAGVKYEITGEKGAFQGTSNGEEDGMDVSGLPVNDTYTFKVTQVPYGYRIPDQKIVFTLNGEGSWSISGATEDDMRLQIVVPAAAMVGTAPESSVPKTGVDSPVAMLSILMLVTAAAGMFLMRKRQFQA